MLIYFILACGIFGDRQGYTRRLDGLTTVYIVSLFENAPSVVRRAKMAAECSKHNLDCTFVHASKKGTTYSNLLALEKCRCRSPNDTCIAMEDDITFHPDLHRQLALTIQALPTTWDLLHMCPQAISGKTGRYEVHPEPGVLPKANNARYYTTFPTNNWGGNGRHLLWPGPIAVLLRCSYRDTLVKRLRAMVHKPVDVAYAYAHNENTYVAQMPPLCLHNFLGVSVRGSVQRRLHSTSGWNAIQQFKNDLQPAIALHEPVVAWVAEHSRLEVWVAVNWYGAILNCTAFQPYRTSGYMGIKCRI